MIDITYVDGKCPSLAERMGLLFESTGLFGMTSSNVSGVSRVIDSRKRVCMGVAGLVLRIPMMLEAVLKPNFGLKNPL